jgi:hypothetical protein
MAMLPLVVDEVDNVDYALAQQILVAQNASTAWATRRNGSRPPDVGLRDRR